MRAVVMGCIIACGFVLPELLPVVYAGLLWEFWLQGRWSEIMATERRAMGVYRTKGVSIEAPLY